MQITTQDKLSTELFNHLADLESTYNLCKAANPGKVNTVIRKKAKEIAAKVGSGPIFEIMRSIYMPFLPETKLLEVLALRDGIVNDEIELIVKEDK